MVRLHLVIIVRTTFILIVAAWVGAAEPTARRKPAILHTNISFFECRPTFDAASLAVLYPLRRLTLLSLQGFDIAKNHATCQAAMTALTMQARRRRQRRTGRCSHCKTLFPKVTSLQTADATVST